MAEEEGRGQVVGPFAHSIPERPLAAWHPLEAHLLSTAKRAAAFAAEFGGSDHAFLAGLWHDLGKYSPEFQAKLRCDADAHCEQVTPCAAAGSSGRARVDHSTAGALHAVERLGGPGRLLAYLIAGHHAGLPDWESVEAGAASLCHRLKRVDLLARARAGQPPARILATAQPAGKPPSGAHPALWLRMLYSCLVDADFLDTESFFDPEASGSRGLFPQLGDLEASLDAHLAGLQAAARATPVNAIRRHVLEACRKGAARPPGAYTLTVPTGGGKTLSSLAFALRHALRHGLRRVIYVIPYTSIIEQTADVFRRALGDVLVEHHSAYEPPPGSEDRRRRLASENWDAPLVVTTSIQFFESLFAARSGRCRKLHNIVASVVVLDEAQMLPPEFLEPILWALGELRDRYRVSLLLTTATQPALEPRREREFTFRGLPGLSELMPDRTDLHRRMRRVKLNLPTDYARAKDWQAVADGILRFPTVLAIVNRRADAAALHKLLGPGTYHLSGLMCGAHRSDTLAAIRTELAAGRPTRVVSTQLVEAGVDLDFPVVFRALAGLDSIAQAAGRCNREGRLLAGEVHVFVPPTPSPVGHLRMAEDCARRLLEGGLDDPFAPESFEQFFRELYWLPGTERLDAHRILECLPRHPSLLFRSAAERFRMIDDAGMAPLVIRYGPEGRALADSLLGCGPDRFLFRRLQRYTVQVPRRALDVLVLGGDALPAGEHLYVLKFDQLYDACTGLRLPGTDGLALDPEGLIV